MASGLISVSNRTAVHDAVPARRSPDKPPRQIPAAQTAPERPIKLRPQPRSHSEALTTYNANAGVNNAPRYGAIDDHA